MKNIVNDAKKFFSKKKNRIRIRALLILGFLLALNTYAWFIYVSTVNNDVSANVVSWDVAFFDDGNEITNEITISVDNMYPGMPIFSKSYDIYNRSETDATFNYTVLSMNFFGTTYTLADEDYTNTDLVSVLKNEFPYVIAMSSTSSVLGINSTMSFNFQVRWPYEGANEYVSLNKYYTYFSHYKYYELVDGDYVEATVNETNFDSKVTAGLYMTSDDADSYWGERSAVFKKANPDSPTLEFVIELKATQVPN